MYSKILFSAFCIRITIPKSSLCLKRRKQINITCTVELVLSNPCPEISAVVVQSPTAVDCCHSNVLFVAAAEHWLTSVGGRVGYLMSIWSAPIVIHNSTSIPLMLPIITPSKRRPHYIRNIGCYVALQLNV